MTGSARAGAQYRAGGSMMVLQAVAALAVVALMAMPPSRGMMLVIPIGGSAIPSFDAGARLIAAGPLPGSLVVEGERAALLPHMLRNGALLFAAPAALCEGISA